MTGTIPLTPSGKALNVGINTLTYMPPSPFPKRQALQTTGTFNPRADQVRHPLFQHSDFFDPQDLLQLKYETLRALQQEDCSLVQASREFGLSRPTIYQAQYQFQAGGIEGLLPRKRGPRQPHKLTAAVRRYLEAQVEAAPQAQGPELVRRVRQRFGVTLHRRTIEKALQSKAKRGPRARP